ncbi:MAG: HNH endonuclease [Chitinophagaceae bacterium]
MQHHCYRCNAPLTKSNQSVEHIIQNCIGGSLRSNCLLCSTCNKALGSTVDSEFSKQFDSLAALLNLKRDRLKSHVIKNLKTKGGDTYHLYNGRNPIPVKPTIEITDDGVYVSARNQQELTHILKQLKKKYPGLDIDNAPHHFQWHREYLREPITIPMTIDVDSFFKGMTKIAVNAYLHFGGDRKHVVNAVQSLNTVSPNVSLAQWFYPIEDIFSGDGEISHTIYIKGCLKEKKLKVFVMLFSCYGVTVDLSNTYDGDDIELTYCYDVLQRKKLEKQLRICFNIPEKEAYLLNKRYLATLQKNLEKLMQIIDYRQAKDSLDDLNRRIKSEILSKYPKGAIANDAILKEIAQDAAAQYAEFVHHLKSRSSYQNPDSA